VRLEVRYPNGSQHEVELSGTVAVLGRDPSCDLVLNDAKCSRRHAVLEAGPQGLAIRDAGSANGIFVNGDRLERASLKDGDVVRLGDVILKILPEEMPGTLVMGPEELEQHAKGVGPPRLPPALAPLAKPLPVAVTPTPRVAPSPPAAKAPMTPKPAPPAPPTPPAPAPPRRAPAPRAAATGPPPFRQPVRTPMLTALAGFWGVGILAYPLFALVQAFSGGWHGLGSGAWVAFGLAMMVVSSLMAWGLWALAGWARILQMLFAGVGLLTCAFTPASALILAYMLKQDTAALFEGEATDEAGGPSETLFTLATVAGVVLPLLLGGLAAALGMTLPGPFGNKPAEARGSVNLQRLHTVYAAQQAFSAGTCGAYADIDGLLKPATIIPNYPPTGPAFLATELAASEANGYRYEMIVDEPVAATDGCPARSFRRFLYTAAPIGGAGKHFVVASDGVIHAAEGRPASTSDPSVE
jgi:hypothetical protein